jgi:hypothetical protein
VRCTKTFVFGQPIFDNQDAPGYSYTNCSDPGSRYYDKKRCTGCAFDAREAAFSRAIGGYWTQFARAGAPANGSEWPAVSPTAAQTEGIYLRAGEVATERDGGRPEACELWDDVHRQTGGLL